MRRTTPAISSSRSRLVKCRAVAVGGDDERAILEDGGGLWSRRLVDARHEIVHACVEPGRKLRLGGHDGDALHAIDPQQQIHIGGPEPAGFDEPIADGDDDALVSRGYPALEQPLTKRMLVERVGLAHPPLVRTVSRDEKARLAQHALRTAIARRARLELGVEQPLEILHLALPAPELVVELQHLAHERGPQMKRREGAFGDRFVRTGLQHHLAIEGRQPPCRAVRPTSAAARTTRRASAMSGRTTAAGGDERQTCSMVRCSCRAAARVGTSTAVARTSATPPVARAGDDGVLVGMEGGRPDEPNLSGRDHGCRGGARYCLERARARDRAASAIRRPRPTRSTR